MQTRFLLGPAGSGKTFRCLEEIRAALKKNPEGKPLILLAPKQATFQLERQLLADYSLSGYTRLQILSFERLADYVLTTLHLSPSNLLSEEGRVMVLRALLLQHKDQLKLFRASARMPGFAQQLSLLLRDFQRHQISSSELLRLSARVEPQLGAKLSDLGFLLWAYGEWLAENRLHDANELLDLAANALRRQRIPGENNAPLNVAALWMDGFAEMTVQERDLLTALMPHCQQATLAFCLENPVETQASSLSIWAGVRKTFEACRERVQHIPGCKVEVETLVRDAKKSRFADSNPLRHLEAHWTAPIPLPDSDTASISETVRSATCNNPEEEAILAAREIRRFVRSGGRYRQAAVLLRRFDGYHQILRRVFSRYEIPYFLDRRESMAHHPLAEFTRSALRLAAFGWEHDDFFCALKTGLVLGNEKEIDELENEALARGWKKESWWNPLRFPDGHREKPWLERLRKEVVPPLLKFFKTASNPNLNGMQLAQAIRALWKEFDVEESIQEWSQSDPTHSTVQTQMQSWLENIELSFSKTTLRANEWLPIVDAGLSGMTVGAVPPALDQVLIGTIDRSRNPDLQLALVLGLNESVFPEPPQQRSLLTEKDQSALAKENIYLGQDRLESLGKERFYGYIACTRARRRLVLTCSAQDAQDRVKNPSPFFSLLHRMFPALPHENISESTPWFESEHLHELIVPILKSGSRSPGDQKNLSIPETQAMSERLSRLLDYSIGENLPAERAIELYGSTLQTSVSALEQYAACPFRFFVSSGMRAQERKVLEMDVREKGRFQHEILAEFHQQLSREKKRWRDISAQEARDRIAAIGEEFKTKFSDGLFDREARNDFAAKNMIASLQDFVEATVRWMKQYEFDPHSVELSFGTAEKTLPAWEMDLGAGRRLAFRGIIDRVDICPLPDGETAWAVIIDYKSSAKQLDPVLLASGVQLQLPAYSAFLRHLADAQAVFGVKRLVPAGVFYVNLRGEFKGGKTRSEVLGGLNESRQNAFSHRGRFHWEALPRLDNRNASTGTQFKYRITKGGRPHGGDRELMETTDFAQLLDEVEGLLLRMGQEIFSGKTVVDPYQKGKTRACDHCDYAGICRIDPWTHKYRVLQ